MTAKAARDALDRVRLQIMKLGSDELYDAVNSDLIHLVYQTDLWAAEEAEK